jgi:hypothetical protein
VFDILLERSLGKFLHPSSSICDTVCAQADGARLNLSNVQICWGKHKVRNLPGRGRPTVTLTSIVIVPVIDNAVL